MEYTHYPYMPYGYYVGTTGPSPLHTNTCVPVSVASGRDASFTISVTLLTPTQVSF